MNSSKIKIAGYKQYVEYDKLRRSAIFSIDNDDKETVCIVSAQVLQDEFRAGSDPAALIKACCANIRSIIDKAKQKLHSNQVEPDGSILITSGDYSTGRR